MSPDYKATIQAKRETVAAESKEAARQEEIIKQLRENQLATLLNGQQKSTVILADSTDLGEKLAELNELIKPLLKGSDAKSASDAQTSALKALQKSIEQLSKVSDSHKDFSEVIKTLKSLKPLPIPAPIVTVPEPKVVVQERKLDFAPLIRAVESLKTTPVIPEERIDLSDFRAQDITEDGDIQYVGFLHPNGSWFIIENRTKENSLRYVFGSKGYAKAFSKASTYVYALLDEAINAL